MNPLDRVLSKLPSATRRGNGFVAFCPTHDDRIKHSLSVRAADDGRVLLHCFAGCGFSDICAALGVAESELFADGPTPPPPPRTRRIEADPAKSSRIARIRAGCGTERTPVEVYLLKRGLTIAAPAPLGAHPGLDYHHEGTVLGTFPAMVAPVTALDGGVRGLHLTYLAANGAGEADVPSPKKLLSIAPGATSGCAIQLMQPGEHLALAEGIETALAVAEATGLPVWTTINAGGMKTVEIPPTVRIVSFWCDRDPSGVGETSARAAADRLAATRAVHVLVPPDTDPKCDWLDVFVRDGAEALRAALVASTSVPALMTSSGDDEADDPGDELAVPVLPDQVWRGVFADYRAALTGTSEVSDAVNFFTLWAIAAARLHRRVSFYLGMTIYPNVYLLSVGPTGDRKTTGMRLGRALLPDDDRVRMTRGFGSAEAFLDWMAEANGPASHLVYLDEIASLLIRGSWTGSTLLPMLTETWDTPPIYELRFRKNPIRVPEPTITLHAGSTPTWFWRNVQEQHFQGGFANRMLYGVGMPKAPIALPRRPDPMAMQALATHLDRLDGVAGEGQLTPDAAASYRTFDAGWRDEVAIFSGLTALATKRVPVYVVKLALVYAALEDTFPTITDDQMMAAIVAGMWAAQCADWLVQQRQADSVQSRCEEAVLHALRTENLPAYKIRRRIGGRFSADEVHRALTALLRIGTVVIAGEGQRGAPIYDLRRGREG